MPRDATDTNDAFDRTSKAYVFRESIEALEHFAAGEPPLSDADLAETEWESTRDFLARRERERRAAERARRPSRVA